MTKEQARCFNRCTRNGIRIYPEPTEHKYTGKGSWKIPPKAIIVIEVNGKQKRGKELYDQRSDELTNKILELYSELEKRL